MKDINAFGDLVVGALQANHYQIDNKGLMSEIPYRFKITFKTSGGNVQHQVRLYPDKVHFEDLYSYDNNALAGGHNTLPLEFMPIYNIILSIYVKETGNIPEVDFVLY
jgi:hypothetical protein